MQLLTGLGRRLGAVNEAVLPEGFPHKKQGADEDTKEAKGSLAEVKQQGADRDQDQVEIAKQQEDGMPVPHVHCRTQFQGFDVKPARCLVFAHLRRQP